MLNANVSNFYAQICNRPNKGFSECHWCGAKASQGVIHDEPPPIPFIRSATQKLAARQRNPWLCNGCVLWRQSSITTWSLQGKIKDGRSPMRCSWWLTEKSALEIRLPDDAQALWKLLLKPPLRFCLALLENEKVNHLQLCFLNDVARIEGETPLWYTLDGLELEYTVYGLEMALNFPEAERAPGVSALLRLLGPCTSFQPPVPVPAEPKRGRPTENEEVSPKPKDGPKKVIRS